MNSSDDDIVLDLDVIATLKALGGDEDPELFGDLVSMFLGDTPPRLLAMDEALTASDMDALEKAAHALKSSCGNLGATTLAQLCRDIEFAGRSGDVEAARPLVEATKAQYEAVRRALRAELG